MNKNTVLIICILLTACHKAAQSEDIQPKQIASEKSESKPLTNNNHKESNQTKNNQKEIVLGIFAYQQTADQLLNQHCIWTNEANATSKQYWSVQPNIELNGQSRFSKKDIALASIVIGKPIPNCSEFYKTEQTPFAYAVNSDRDWVNSIAMTKDQIFQNTDGTVSIDLDQNGKAEQSYVCLNSESMDVFFKENIHDKKFVHTHVRLSYSVEGGVDDALACNDSFFSKLGIVQKEDAQTGNVIYLSK